MRLFVTRELGDTDGLADAARSCDGAIHLAFDHDFSRYQHNIDVSNNGGVLGHERPSGAHPRIFSAALRN